MGFEKGNQYGKKSSRAGVPNREKKLPKDLTDSALEQLKIAVDSGEIKSILWTLERTFPALKGITDPNSLNGRLLQLQIDEISSFEERLSALEALNERAD
jgi:hypothetical protein